jgi:hypothetical protein
VFDSFDSEPGDRPLALLAERFGHRLSEIALEPGLLAAVDQHAAAIREAIVDCGPLREALSEYVLGFVDALRKRGWREHDGYDFATLRLTAVCHLIHVNGLADAS